MKTSQDRYLCWSAESTDLVEPCTPLCVLMLCLFGYFLRKSQGSTIDLQTGNLCSGILCGIWKYIRHARIIGICYDNGAFFENFKKWVTHWRMQFSLSISCFAQDCQNWNWAILPQTTCNLWLGLMSRNLEVAKHKRNSNILFLILNFENCDS